MKFLVTGGEGFIGTALIRKLLQEEEKHTVISVDNHLTSDGSRRVPDFRVRYIMADICDATILEECLPDDIDVVFHLAAQSRIQPSFEDPVTTFHNNVEGTTVICDWARRHKVQRFIFSGSSSKHHLHTASSPYAVSKSIAEQICRMYQTNFFLRVDIVRFYNVYGEGQTVTGDYAAVIGKWIGLVADKKYIPIVGNGEQRRDFTHISDIVDGLIRIISCTKEAKDAWELGTGENHSINEVFTMLLKRFPSAKSTFVPDQSGNYATTLRVNDESLHQLDWKPKKRLKDYFENLTL